jgi:hypothetical protein
MHSTPSRWCSKAQKHHSIGYFYEVKDGHRRNQGRATWWGLFDPERKRADHLPDMPIHIYDDAGHGFSCDARARITPNLRLSRNNVRRSSLAATLSALVEGRQCLGAYETELVDALNPT